MRKKVHSKAETGRTLAPRRKNVAEKRRKKLIGRESEEEEKSS